MRSAVILFASYVEADPSGWPPDDIRYSLGGCDLACWCDLPAPAEPDICHCAVLLSLANGWEIPSWITNRRQPLIDVVTYCAATGRNVDFR